MKILVALPVYDGKLQVQSVKCLLEEQAIACGLGDELRVMFLPSCSQIGMGRNYFAKMFMESDCDKLFFLDADVTFEAGSILKTAKRPEDFVAGVYRYKMQEEGYPVRWIPGDLQATASGLLEVETTPGGFLAVSRKVFETLEANQPFRKYTHMGVTAHCFFHMPYQNGALWSEDSLFCKEWRDCGGKAYIDPELTLTHWDFNVPFVGTIGRWLKRLNGLEVA